MTMCRRARASLVGALLAAVVSAACTGSSDRKQAVPAPAARPRAAGAPTTAPPPAREQYIRQGDALCATWNQKNEAAPQLPENAALAERAQRAQYVLSTIDRPFVEQFKALPAPPGDKAAVGRLHAALDSYLKKSQDLIGAMRAGRQVEKLDAELEEVHHRFHDLAYDFGFDTCSDEAQEDAAAPAAGRAAGERTAHA